MCRELISSSFLPPPFACACASTLLPHAQSREPAETMEEGWKVLALEQSSSEHHFRKPWQRNRTHCEDALDISAKKEVQDRSKEEKKGIRIVCRCLDPSSNRKISFCWCCWESGVTSSSALRYGEHSGEGLRERMR